MLVGLVGATGFGIKTAILRVVRFPLAPKVGLAAPPEDWPLSPLSPLTPALSSMDDSGASGALARLAATALEITPLLVTRGSLRESEVFLRYPRDTSDPWLKNTAIFSNIRYL